MKGAVVYCKYRSRLFNHYLARDIKCKGTWYLEAGHERCRMDMTLHGQSVLELER